MHDGLAFSREDAIALHGRQAAASRARLNRLSTAQKAQLVAFLDSP